MSSAHTRPKQLGPYRILEALGRGGMGTVYRAKHPDHDRYVAVKTVRLARQRLRQRIRREIQALARIRHPGVVRIVDSGIDAEQPWYAMELIEGVTLNKFVPAVASDVDPPPTKVLAKRNGSTRRSKTLWWTESLRESSGDSTMTGSAAPLLSPPDSAEAPFCAGPQFSSTDDESASQARILSLVRRLCAPLAFLHGEGIVHRDIKPTNVLVVTGDRPMFVDFGLSSEFGGDESRESLAADHQASGTALYMAPEQIRGEFVDARADLYSLGCVLYELLTGRPPFSARTTQEVLHAHLHARPTPPSAILSTISVELDDVVLRLLSKDARDRFGYAEDVSSALARIGAMADLDANAPRPRMYLYRSGFAGRERTLRRMDGLLDGSNDRGQFVAVGGESGVGKTRLVMELSRRATNRDIQVILGEGVQGQGRPLELLRQPLQAIADRCWELGPAFTKRILGPRGALLARYEPSISTLPGQGAHPAPENLPAEPAQARLYAYLAETLAEVAEERPLLLILDDLQWADALTLGFLRFIAREQPRRVLTVGTYRTDEVSAGLARLLEEPACVSVSVSRLGVDAVESMICDMFAINQPPMPLVRFVARQSEGNPFFVAEYLRAAMQEGLVYRDQAGRWQVAEYLTQWSSSDLDSAVPPPLGLRNVVQRRLKSLSADACVVSEMVSVAGREVEVGLLQRVVSLEETAFLDAVSELLHRQVLEEVDSGRIRFVHDKIREAARDEMSQSEVRSRHQRFASVLEAGPQSDDAYVYALADHYAAGLVRQNPRRVYETNADAGQLALRTDAAAVARRYFASAERAAVLAPCRLEAKVSAAWGEACMRTGSLDEAAQHLENGVRETDNTDERARIRARLAAVYLSGFEAPKAWNECEHALRDLGVPMAASAIGQVASAGWAWLRAVSANRRPRATDMRDAQRLRLETLASVYQTAQAASYYQMNALRWVQFTMQLLYPANRLGPSQYLVQAYAAYALGLASLKLHAAARKYADRAVAIAKRLDDRYAIALSLAYRAFASSFMGQTSEGIVRVRHVLDEHGRWLDGHDYFNATTDLTWNFLMQGRALAAWDVQQLILRKLRDTHGDEGDMESHATLSQRFLALAMLGRDEEAREAMEHARHVVHAAPNNRVRACWYFCHLVMYHCELEDFDASLDCAISEFKKRCPPPRLTPHHMRCFYVFQAYARLRQVEAAQPSLERMAYEQLREAIGQLALVSTIPIIRCHLHLVKGALFLFRGRPRNAKALFRRAEREACRVGCVWALFEVERYRARLQQSEGDARRTHIHARRAWETAHEYGWIHRKRSIQHEFSLVEASFRESPKENQPFGSTSATL